MSGAISGTNITRLRYVYQRVTNVKLNIFRKVVKATADIDQSTFDYPLAELTVDNTSAGWADVREGELFAILDGSGNVVYTDIHRKNPTADTIYFSRIQLGTNQRAVFTAAAIADNYQVVSYHTQSVGSFNSRVDEVASVTTIYKRVDIELDTDDPQPQYPKPQPNLGTWQQANAASDGTAQFDIDASPSLSMINLDNSTLSYLHEPPDGVTIVTGMDTDATVTVEADTPGQYVYSVRVEDSDIPGTSPQQQKRGFRYLFVNDSTTYPAFNDEYTVEILKDEEGLDGRSITFRAYGNGAYDELYTGAPVLLTYDIQVRNLPSANWIDLDDGLTRRTFVGYITSFNRLRAGSDGVEIVEFTAESPLLLYNRFPIANQLLEEAATVTNWQQTVAALMHVVFAIYYALEYHSPASFYLHDLLFAPDADDFKSNPFPIRAGSITAAAKTLAERIFGFFTCHSNGTLLIKRNPNVENDTYRNAVATVWTWQEQDVDDSDGDGVEYELNEYLTVKETTGSFIYYDSGENQIAAGRANLYSPAQATGSQTLPDHIALSQADGLARIGHMHQMANRPVLDIELKALGLTGEYVSPADVEWHMMDFDAFDIGGVNVFNMRHLPTKNIRQWTIDKRGVTLRHQLLFEPETKGLPAQEVEYEPPTGGTVPPSNSWSYTFDFTTDGGDWYIYIPEEDGTIMNNDALFHGSPRGTYVGGTGWQQDAFVASDPGIADNRWVLAIRYDFSVNATLTGLAFTVIVPGGGGRSITHGGYYYNDLGDQLEGTRSTATGTVNYTLSIPSVLCQSIGLISAWHSGSSSFTVGTLTSVTVTGTGVNPFI